ncbi:hypothetical protein M758_9G013600 [Ceratodon purpureus]|uniref:Secreted protein n=1 Tax=Ceratodon purpureus TaxID=3225 RepID=A0A8T0GML9_CERPU|nr:hypothetical protein KC19_9G014100 [Ceratodon purpureus]KAG0604854.1 hypothetical protein M758_9G013600 [Ceratodon purpureus]
MFRRSTLLLHLHALAQRTCQARAEIHCLPNFLHMIEFGEGHDLLDGDGLCLRRWTTGNAQRSEGPKFMHVPCTKIQL